MEEVYRLKSGRIFNSKFQKDIRFCIIYSDHGLLKMDLYYDSNETYNSNEIHDIIRESFSIQAVTTKDETVQINELHSISFNNGNGLIRLTCYGTILIIEKEYTDNGELALQKDISKEQMIHSIELEGMKIEFTDLTHKAEIIDGSNIGRMIDFTLDHTDALLSYKKDEHNFAETYRVTIANSSNSYTSSNLNMYFCEEILEYQEYMKFKEDLICFLSLINGAEVAIRKEIYSSAFSPIHTAIYSFKNIDNQKYSSYIPINSPFHRDEDIIPFFFLFCFDNYRKYNKTLDFNYTVRFLCNASQASSMEQCFITLIVAFERLSSLTLKIEDKQLLKDKEFNDLKTNLINEIDNLKKSNNINGTSDEKLEKDEAYEKFKNKIRSLGNSKKSIENKFFRLLDYSNVNITSEMKNVIAKVRNDSIHEGNIGKWPENLKNCFVLDELLRDIILNLIGYKKSRDSRVYK